jgi:DNA-binding NtrC family response regulator
VPPLRQRPEDIAELARHFLTRIAAEEGKRVRAINADAMALLHAYRWPGNVRQLENAIFRAVVLAEAEEIGVAEFPQISAQADCIPVQPAIEPYPVMIVDPPAPSPAPVRQGPTLRLTDANGAVRPLEEIEREVIRFAIAHHRGQMSEVARRLKIGRSTLYRKLDEERVDAGE